MNDIVIVSATRTPIGSFLGSLASVSAPKLGAAVIERLLSDTGIAADAISEVIMGNVLTTGVGQNPARQAAIFAGLPHKTPATTVNVVCGSGLKAVQMGVQAIKAGDAKIVIAGGQESMSQSPHFIHIRDGQKMGNTALTDSMVADGLTDVYNGYHMGITAENVAEKLGIDRTSQDEFALNSQIKATNAQNGGKFTSQITPVAVPQRKGEPVLVDKDEYIKPNTTSEALAKLKPAFKKDGTVTAGNASGLNDGAAAVMLMSGETAKELGLTPLVKVVAYSVFGIDPAVMGLGPVGAVEKVLDKAGWSLDEVDLIEANEAFAAQALGVAKELGLDDNKVNVNGGAIALGHPIGASGCRILVTLIHELIASGKQKGIATLCVGGGMGLAMAVERV
ncbi:acetyl-CoA C-acetyltransferase [Moraxella nasicaprae]|uniref:Acetyl-CoA C-acetyltransferase n=1 Tax=Moraxella nasicaprae TaxID=2904122 RepID=A0ABY6F769_9GAMM|nr:acetyl-CoA C-acetyltransferase [Moraxella nasicaprae]UXZ05777.1 acetyl-CoA C-acetyltransferase [Moraxella nasicaprae]